MKHQFDELAKELAQGVSRREALRRVGSSLAGALLASLGLGALAARPAAAFDDGTACGQTCNGDLAHCQATIQPCRKACEDAVYKEYLALVAACAGNNTCIQNAYNTFYVPAQQRCTANAYAAAQYCNASFGQCTRCCHDLGHPCELGSTAC